ncbi:hypothetical protein AXF42_Ash018172 [Apostasia shenzhenica]|uniref:COP1-interacting protein 7 n=1 Tax=Apostasia shenzhenica TaxID=1088818 RepID=A0A2I0AF31_9ASPA|nr:hypothetical protein AXF42_Ash018172 [Apostasia shenzhenica]
MRSETRLDSAVFQLTPTRTRCDLVITANGKTEKIASGLVNPFLSHLKTAQEQIAKGGYSIKLEPDPATEAAWFTKTTVERFVRFVSTPEVLERVNTIETEILQIEEAISIQGNDYLALNSVEEHQQIRSTGSNEGNKPTFDTDADKAIVLYKPGSQPTPIESNGSRVNEENSKVHLLRVLESRKKVLQKEQAMAFARATAANFDLETMTHLISFAESFGASRLREACIQYMQLWKGKHETGQWIEVEAAEALSYRSEYSPLANSGIILSGDSMKPREFVEAWPVSGGGISSESNVDLGSQVKGEFNGLSSDNDKAKRQYLDPHIPHGPSEYHQGQVQQLPFPQWTSQPGPHIYQPYGMHPMPYYQTYPGNGQFFHPPYPPVEDPRFTNYNRKEKKKHSNHGKDGISDLEDGTEESESECEEETHNGRSSHQKAGRSRKKKGVVVIRNLNYIAGKGSGIGNGLDSTTESEMEENKDSISDSGERKQRSSEYAKTKDFHNKSLKISDAHGMDQGMNFHEADAGNWQAFQSFLLRAEEKLNSAAEGDIFAGEKESLARKGHKKGGFDPILLERITDNCNGERDMEFDEVSGRASRTKLVASNEELIVSSDGKGLVDSQPVALFTEIEGGIIGYRKAPNDSFIIDGREKQMGNKISADPLVDCENVCGGYSEKSSSHHVIDDSFMVSVRSGSHHELGADLRVPVDVDSEFLSAPQRKADPSIDEETKISYVPDDLTLMLDNTRGSESLGFDPAIDYDIQVPLLVKQEAEKEDAVATSTKESIKKTDLENKLKSPQDGLQKKRKDAMMRKVASLRSTPLTEAQKKAEKLRNYKADLQKQKKEQEEENIRRLDALKRERQKRIAARSGSNGVHSSGYLQQPRSSLPVKVSASAYKMSKFLDSETGSSSPLQKLSRRSSSTVSCDSSHATKTTKSYELSQPSSSLPELRKENIKQENSTSVAIRRLSKSKGNTVHSAPAKSASTNQVRQKPLAEEPQSKKISAIIQLDKTKSATLPELKIKTYRTPSEDVRNKAATKQHKGAENRSSVMSNNNNANRSEEKAPCYTCSDENPVIEKTVVVLENEAVHTPMVQTSMGKTDSVDKSCREVKRETSGEDTGIAAVRAPPLPFDADEIKNPGGRNHVDQLNSYEIENDFSKDEFQKVSLPTVTGKTCQAPIAKASTMEVAASGIDIINAGPSYVQSFSLLDQMDETYEKPRHKGSKGLRKLWKLGRRTSASTSGDAVMDSDGSVVEDHSEATSNDNSTLKNLISQDENHSRETPPKVSRHFSILSPFRGRTNEKKVAMNL